MQQQGRLNSLLPKSPGWALLVLPGWHHHPGIPPRGKEAPLIPERKLAISHSSQRRWQHSPVASALSFRDPAWATNILTCCIEQKVSEADD